MEQEATRLYRHLLRASRSCFPPSVSKSMTGNIREIYKISYWASRLRPEQQKKQIEAGWRHLQLLQKLDRQTDPEAKKLLFQNIRTQVTDSNYFKE